MTEYDELVKMLRTCSERDSCIGWKESCPYLGTGVCDNKAEKAADAIEELSAFREQITDGRFYCMRDGVLYEAKVELPKGKAFQLPPIEFAEGGE